MQEIDKKKEFFCNRQLLYTLIIIKKISKALNFFAVPNRCNENNKLKKLEWPENIFNKTKNAAKFVKRRKTKLIDKRAPNKIKQSR